MSNHAPKVDLGSKLIFVVSLVAIVLTVYVLVTSLINTFQKNMTKGEIIPTSHITSASDNLKPIGMAATSDTAAPVVAVAARSGKEVYTVVCSVCHKTGVAGAPKLEDKAAWEPRVATGLDALMNTAINGKGAMPARAGQNIGDEELKATILYMTKEAGFDLGGGAAPAASKAPEPAKKEEAPAKAEPKKAVEKVAELAVPPTKPAAPTEPAAPVVTATEKAVAPVVAAVEKVAEAAPAAKSDGAAVYAAKGCAACHGADAKTPIMPLYPKIAGQGVVYVTQQLTDIKSGKRSNGQSVVMKGIMAGVSEDEIAILAEYLSSLK